VAARLESLGFSSPLPIQLAAVPAALAGRNVCGKAPTGCGKTLAFGIPLAEAAASGSTERSPRALVLVPTRELAEQVRAAIAQLCARPERVVAIYGGTGYEPQQRALRRGIDIAVACPGRLEDLFARRDIRLDRVQTVVIDEADRMVDMGFVHPVRRLLDATAAARQVLLFSATLGPEVRSIVRDYLEDPFSCDVEEERAPDVAHHFWSVSRPDRVGVTARVVADHGQGFVFCRTKRGADRLARQLRAENVEAAPIHGDLSQAQRSRALAAFASGRLQALVATDVVARGIHVDDVPCVVHFDPPADATSYVHRAGRTGRVGRRGVVVSLVPEDARLAVRDLQRSLGFSPELTKPFASGQEPARPSTREARRESRLEGTVKFFDIARGYGFLSAPDGSDVFVHQSKLRSSGAKRAGLRKGDSVTFAVVRGRRGQEAHDVATARRGAA
jgi:superfamily II DNA/RNA helicase